MTRIQSSSSSPQWIRLHPDDPREPVAAHRGTSSHSELRGHFTWPLSLQHNGLRVRCERRFVWRAAFLEAAAHSVIHIHSQLLYSLPSLLVDRLEAMSLLEVRSKGEDPFACNIYQINAYSYAFEPSE